jgi:hydroxymethylglutaryl-CoA reductase
MQAVKGMVQVGGATYRIARVLPHVYEAVRILDNQVAGWFTSDLSVVAPKAADFSTLRTIAQEAVKQGKTSWVGRTAAATEPKTERSDVSGVRDVESLAAVASAEEVSAFLRARNGQ